MATPEDLERRARDAGGFLMMRIDQAGEGEPVICRAAVEDEVVQLWLGEQLLVGKRKTLREYLLPLLSLAA